ncbi:MAG: TlpA family protein disulfide reductase [Burkholderiaceae bacterium]|nr:TlpA family protein disulfide reductase [Burkholderiaceae bacterium]
MKRNFLLIAIVAFAATGLGLYVANHHLHPESSPSRPEQGLFGLVLPDMNNKNQALSQWKGKTLVVNFWATWCVPCVQEMPELSALQSGHQLGNAQLIGIGIDSAKNIAQFADKYKISYPLYVAGMGGSSLLRQMGDAAGGLPFTVLVGTDGQIKKTYLSRLDMNEIQRDVAALESTGRVDPAHPVTKTATGEE